jgi:hypothetical protein
MNTPAFPVLTDEVSHMGMTLRDYFAAKAMQGMLAEGRTHLSETVAKASYEYADAMLKARDK